MPKVTTSTGIILDTDQDLAKLCMAFAKNRGLENVVVCHSLDTDGREEYVILQNNEAFYAHSSVEVIYAKIDIMALKKAVKT